jgi:hypothetical protein
MGSCGSVIGGDESTCPNIDPEPDRKRGKAHMGSLVFKSPSF